MKPHALEIADRGWPVFPCNRDKKPMTANGFKDASTDEDQILEWWGKNPEANIGVPTGKKVWVFRPRYRLTRRAEKP